MLGLYIHIPFCIKKCRYCDFISYSGCESYFEEYLTALSLEAKKYRGIFFDTVFIGGGTPTLLSPKELSRLTDILHNTLCISQNAEISIEANPKTLTEEKLRVLSAGGVNRISIGVQSFDDDELLYLGRVHTAKEAALTVELAKKYINNLNIDLMFSLPHQTADTVIRSLNTALSLSPTHISCYSLILEEGTELYSEYENGRLTPLDEDEDRHIFDRVCKLLSKNGYNRYEISNFALPGFECRHNLKYWCCDEYIGIGAAAHSFYDGKRFYNTSDLKRYVNGDFHEDCTVLSEWNKMSEFMIMGLRKTAGIKISEFKKRFSKNPYEVFDIKRFEECGLILSDGEIICLSDRGLDVSNSILCEFV